MKKYFIIFPLLLFLNISPLNAQNTLSGIVTDAKTGEPVAGVNIFIDGTTKGTSTDGKGRYELRNIPSGESVIVFSFVGYETKQYKLEIENTSPYKYNIKLQPQTYDMNELQIVSSNKEWKKNYKRFQEAFLGRTEFAQQTTIENPEELSFETTGNANSLIAKADKSLIINNQALGYKIHIELVEFKWSGSLDTGIYKIFSRYEPLAAKNYKQQETWIENRVRAYLGSFNQFLESLYKNDLVENNFALSRTRNITLLSKSEARYEARRQGRYLGDHLNTLRGFRIDQRTSVDYRNVEKVKMGDREIKVVIRKRGAIKSNTKNNVFFVRKSGKILDPASVIIYGHWARTRVADNLPSNYQLGD